MAGCGWIGSPDLAVLDRYADAAGTSRSAVTQRAIRMSGDPALADAYAAAWDEWESSGDAAAWDSALADGLVDAARCNPSGQLPSGTRQRSRKNTDPLS
jgi:hypothetical protein